MEVDQYTAVITGTLTHNGSTKKNLRFSIPCFDKKGNKVGDAIATIDELEKGKKWKFRAILNEENVAACKIKDAYITVEENIKETIYKFKWLYNKGCSFYQYFFKLRK